MGTTLPAIIKIVDSSSSSSSNSSSGNNNSCSSSSSSNSSNSSGGGGGYNSKQTNYVNSVKLVLVNLILIQNLLSKGIQNILTIQIVVMTCILPCVKK